MNQVIDDPSFDRLEFAPGRLSADYHIESVGHRLAREIRPLSPGQPFLLGVSTVYITGEYEFPRHRHTLYEVIVVEQGPYRCSLNGTELLVDGRQALIIKPGDVHQVHLRSNQRHHIVHFRYGEGQEGNSRLALFAPGSAPKDQLVELRDGTLPEILRRLRQEVIQPDGYSARLQDVLMEEFFWQLVRALNPRAVSPHLSGAAESVCFKGKLDRLFQEHAGERLSVGDMARTLGMSKRSLSAACHRHLEGCSPANAYMRFKVDQALHLLVNDATPIKEISYGLGFKNPFHFSKVFKRTVGVSPLGWRKTRASFSLPCLSTELPRQRETG